MISHVGVRRHLPWTWFSSPQRRMGPRQPWAWPSHRWIWSDRRVLYRTFVILFIVATLLRLYAMKVVPLAPEEAYYWDYAQHPSLSYFDNPPMVAWLIRAGTAVFGNTEFGVCWLSTITMLAACGAIYLFTRIWWTRQTAILTGAALLLLPGYFTNSMMGTMDP